MGQGDRERHQLGRLPAREAEHHSLVAGAQLVGRCCVLAHLEGRVDAHGDVTRLLLDAHERAAGQVVEAVVGTGIADFPDGVPDHGLEVDIGRCADLSEDHHQARGGCGLAGNPRIRIGGDDRVEDRVAHLIAHLVGVTLGHRFGGEQVLLCVDDAGHAAPLLRLGVGGEPALNEMPPMPVAG